MATVFYNRLSRLSICGGSEEVGHYGFVLESLYLADFVASFGGELVVVFVAGVQVEGRKGEVVFAALTIKNLICFLEFLVLVELSFVESAFGHLRVLVYR